MAFGYPIDLYASSPPAERSLIEPVISSLTINYMRDLRKGKIKPDPAIDAAQSRYTAHYADRQRKRS